MKNQNDDNEPDDMSWEEQGRYWPPDPLTKDLFADIGRVAVEWAYLENQIDLWISDFLGNPDNCEIESVLNIPFKKRMRLWRDLLEQEQMNPEATALLLTVIDKASNLRDRRDLVIHGRWGLNPLSDNADGVVMWRFTDTWNVEIHPIKRDQLKKLAERIRALTEELVEFGQKHGYPEPTFQRIPSPPES